MKISATVIFIILLVSCRNADTQINFKMLRQAGVKPIVVLQPLSYNGQFLELLSYSVSKYYPVTVTIANNIGLPANAWYPPRGRYRAGSILAFLLSVKPAQARVVAGITGVDISTPKGTNPDYGIMGLGLQPGDACVVSTFRLNKDNPGDKLLFQRLLKTLLHEIGHNFGLPHCSNKHCIMADAEGKLSQDNETSLCAVCSKRLGLQ